MSYGSVDDIADDLTDLIDSWKFSSSSSSSSREPEVGLRPKTQKSASLRESGDSRYEGTVTVQYSYSTVQSQYSHSTVTIKSQYSFQYICSTFKYNTFYSTQFQTDWPLTNFPKESNSNLIVILRMGHTTGYSLQYLKYWILQNLVERCNFL